MDPREPGGVLFALSPPQGAFSLFFSVFPARPDPAHAPVKYAAMTSAAETIAAPMPKAFEAARNNFEAFKSVSPSYPPPHPTRLSEWPAPRHWRFSHPLSAMAVQAKAYAQTFGLAALPVLAGPLAMADDAVAAPLNLKVSCGCHFAGSTGSGAAAPVDGPPAPDLRSLGPTRSLPAVLASQVVGAGLATIALAGVGVGIGSVYAALIQGCAIQPSAGKELFGHAILGFAMVEAVGLFAMMLAFLILFGSS